MAARQGTARPEHPHRNSLCGRATSKPRALRITDDPLPPCPGDRRHFRNSFASSWYESSTPYGTPTETEMSSAGRSGTVDHPYADGGRTDGAREVRNVPKAVEWPSGRGWTKHVDGCGRQERAVYVTCAAREARVQQHDAGTGRTADAQRSSRKQGHGRRIAWITWIAWIAWIAARERNASGRSATRASAAPLPPRSRMSRPVEETRAHGPTRTCDDTCGRVGAGRASCGGLWRFRTTEWPWRAPDKMRSPARDRIVRRVDVKRGLYGALVRAIRL